MFKEEIYLSESSKALKKKYTTPVSLQFCQNLSNAAAAAKSLRLCPTLCDPVDGSPLGSSVPGILQVRILEWVAISFSNNLSNMAP